MVGDIEFEQGVQFGQDNERPVALWQRTAGKTGAGTSRDEWNLVFDTELNDQFDLFSGFWQHYNARKRSVLQESVTFVCPPTQFIGDHCVGSQHLDETRDKCLQL
jgi:hypothetical protein